MQKWSALLYEFYHQLKPQASLPQGIQWLNPQQDPQVLHVTKLFFDRFYNDSKPRHLLLGINPGRFGAGVTGVNFTAPRQLKEACGIDHPFRLQSELSAEFIYEMIAAYGGAQKFYGDHFIGSVCPLGFVKNGKNINYYDDPELLRSVTPFITGSLVKLTGFPFQKNKCGCIGGEKNYRFLQQLNKKYQWFTEIIPLPHPRFIMQYKRKSKEKYVDQYLDFLTSTF